MKAEYPSNVPKTPFILTLGTDYFETMCPSSYFCAIGAHFFYMFQIQAHVEVELFRKIFYIVRIYRKSCNKN